MRLYWPLGLLASPYGLRLETQPWVLLEASMEAFSEAFMEESIQRDTHCDNSAVIGQVTVQLVVPTWARYML